MFKQFRHNKRENQRTKIQIRRSYSANRTETKQYSKCKREAKRHGEHNEMSNIHLIRLPKGEKRRAWRKITFEEIMAKNFSELFKDIKKRSKNFNLYLDSLL